MEILCPDAEFDRAVTRYTDFGVSFGGLVVEAEVMDCIWVAQLHS